VASVGNARFWPLRAANGKLVTGKNVVDKVTGQEIKWKKDEKIEGDDHVAAKVVPVLVGGENTRWIPKTTDPSNYGPKEERGGRAYLVEVEVKTTLRQSTAAIGIIEAAADVVEEQSLQGSRFLHLR
jgi:hypothetical protein